MLFKFINYDIEWCKGNMDYINEGCFDLKKIMF